MKDLLNQGEAWLADKQTEFAARTILYVRAANTPFSMAATLGRSEFEVTDSNGILTTVETRDYLVRPSDFAIIGSANEPIAGDVIEDGDQRYEVVAPGPRMQPWRWSGDHRKRLRIHTKLIA